MIQIRSWNFPQASRAGGGGRLPRTLGGLGAPRAAPRVTVCSWAGLVCARARGGPSRARVCVNDAGPVSTWMCVCAVHAGPWARR